MGPNLDDPIDRAVWEFQQGIRREENFQIIVRRFYRPVKSFLLMRGLSTDDALDLNQVTFLKVYTGLDGYGWIAKFSSWLFTIAVNVYRNWRGGESRRERVGAAGPSPDDSPPTFGEEREPVEIDAGKDPLNELLSEEQARLLHEAVDELSPQMRKCVVLRLQDLNYQEIADKMGRKIGTVKADLNVAREKLRAKLEDCFDTIDF